MQSNRNHKKNLEIDSGRFSETAPDNLSPGRPLGTNIDPKTTPKCIKRALNMSATVTRLPWDLTFEPPGVPREVKGEKRRSL